MATYMRFKIDAEDIMNYVEVDVKRLALALLERKSAKITEEFLASLVEKGIVKYPATKKYSNKEEKENNDKIVEETIKDGKNATVVVSIPFPDKDINLRLSLNLKVEQKTLTSINEKDPKNSSEVVLGREIKLDDCSFNIDYQQKVSQSIEPKKKNNLEEKILEDKFKQLFPNSKQKEETSKPTEYPIPPKKPEREPIQC